MTTEKIITKFNLFMDDSTELSASEQLDLFNKHYKSICSYRPWEFTKKEFSGTTDGNQYISAPTDFAYFTANNDYSGDASNYRTAPVIFVNNDEYKVISWSDRRRYQDQKGYAWYDAVNERIYFSKTPATGLTVSFDYHFVPADATTATVIIIPQGLEDIIYHSMCVDDFIIQQSPKAKSYASENNSRYNDYLSQLAYRNARLIQE